ncbi:MAG: hypothetical protein JSR21_01565 [Proteobacteria bacterium]|nr:hypothetical protein [Pseudomonadota bacterium]
MDFRRLGLSLLLGSPLLMAACASNDQAAATQNLGDRLQARLSADAEAGRVSVERLPSGARVTIQDSALFGPDGVALTAGGRSVMTGVVQALLDPSWQQVAMAAGPDTPATLQGPRARAMERFFADHGLGGMVAPDPAAVTAQAMTAPQSPSLLGPAPPPPAGAPVSGATVTISVMPPAGPAPDNAAPLDSPATADAGAHPAS